jgi:Arc-like DNA binding domain
VRLVFEFSKKEFEMNKAHVKKTSFAMPSDVTDWLKKMARHNVSSMTSEIVRVVRDRMNQDLRAGRTYSATREAADGQV